MPLRIARTTEPPSAATHDARAKTSLTALSSSMTFNSLCSVLFIVDPRSPRGLHACCSSLGLASTPSCDFRVAYRVARQPWALFVMGFLFRRVLDVRSSPRSCRLERKSAQIKHEYHQYWAPMEKSPITKYLKQTTDCTQTHNTDSCQRIKVSKKYNTRKATSLLVKTRSRVNRPTTNSRRELSRSKNKDARDVMKAAEQELRRTITGGSTTKFMADLIVNSNKKDASNSVTGGCSRNLLRTFL